MASARLEQVEPVDDSHSASAADELLAFHRRENLARRPRKKSRAVFQAANHDRVFGRSRSIVNDGIGFNGRSAFSLFHDPHSRSLHRSQRIAIVTSKWFDGFLSAVDPGGVLGKIPSQRG